MPTYPNNNRPYTRSLRHTLRLNTYFERIFDEIELCLPAIPMFYQYQAPSSEFTDGYAAIFTDYSSKNWDILSASSLQNSFTANEAIRQEIKDIENSGISGITYVLKHPAKDQTDAERVLDNTLLIWQNNLPSTLTAIDLMYEHVALCDFDAWIYKNIKEYIETKPTYTNFSSQELSYKLKKNKHINSLIGNLVDTAYSLPFAETLFNLLSYEEQRPELIQMYIDHCEQQHFNFDQIINGALNEDAGILKAALNQRLQRQTELQDNLQAQLRLQSPLQTQDSRLIRENGPMLLEHFIKSYKLEKYQATGESHIVIDLHNVESGQRFFDLALASLIKASPSHLPQNICSFIHDKEQGNLEIPLCPDDSSPLFAILSQADCIKDEAGNDRIFENADDSQVRKIKEEPNYKKRITKDLKKYINGHTFPDLSQTQAKCLKEMGISPKIPITQQPTNKRKFVPAHQFTQQGLFKKEVKPRKAKKIYAERNKPFSNCF